MEAYQTLEHRWAEFNGLAPVGMVACSSGTAALHLALEGMQLPTGSAVICPTYAMIAVPRAVILAGLTPVLVDCSTDLNINPSLLLPLGSTTAERALVAVHTYGRQCNMEGIGYWCKVSVGGPITKPVSVIEDLAEAHGVRPNRYTDAACWSFYKNKVVAGEEGGAVWFRDPERARLARSLRSLGFTDAHDFWHVPRGHNYRLSNIHAAWIMDRKNPNGLAWVSEKVTMGKRGGDMNNIELRREAEAAYDAECSPEWRMPPRDVPWVYDLLLPVGADQDGVVHALQATGIAARHGFKPVHLQGEFRGCRTVGGRTAEEMGRRVIYLPLVGDIRAAEAFRIIRDNLKIP